MKKRIKAVLRKIRDNAKSLTRQQIKTLCGQALAGDVDGAEKGLEKILRRRGNKSEYADSND